MTATYPVSLTLAGRRVLVVGGGKVATRRIGDLIQTGARVEVVSPVVSREIAAWADQQQVTVALRPFEADDVSGAWLCVAATDDRAVNHSVVVSAEREHVLVSAGVTSVLNFAPTVIAVPPGVSLRKVDLSIELQILSFYQQRREEAEGGQVALGGLSS